MTALLQNAKAFYNVGRLTQSLATCVLRHGDELQAAVTEIKASIRELETALAPIVASSTVLERMLPTATNFVYIITEQAPEIFAKMQEHGVLIRQPQKNALRINCGTEEENAACVTALQAVLKELEA